MLRRLLAGYGKLVNRSPFISQIITGGILTTTGDVIAQKIQNRSGDYNLKRTLVMSTFGFCYFGPLVSTWLMILRRLNMSLLPTVLCDQFLAAPCIVGGFIFLHPILSGKTVEEAKAVFKSSYFDILLKGWLFWCPTQLVNFALVPFEFRMLFIQTLALVWNTFLSYKSNSSLKKTQTE